MKTKMVVFSLFVIPTAVLAAGCTVPAGPVDPPEVALPTNAITAGENTAAKDLESGEVVPIETPDNEASSTGEAGHGVTDASSGHGAGYEATIGISFVYDFSSEIVVGTPITLEVGARVAPGHPMSGTVGIDDVVGDVSVILPKEFDVQSVSPPGYEQHGNELGGAAFVWPGVELAVSQPTTPFSVTIDAVPITPTLMTSARATFFDIALDHMWRGGSLYVSVGDGIGAGGNEATGFITDTFSSEVADRTNRRDTSR